jgi:hypothetical protein
MCLPLEGQRQKWIGSGYPCPDINRKYVMKLSIMLINWTNNTLMTKTAEIDGVANEAAG